MARLIAALAFALWLPAASPAAPQRIVTLSPHLAELVCAAGGCERLVAVSRYTDRPPSAAGLPQIGDAHSVNAESLLALRPDLVLVWDGGTPTSSVEKLARAGLPLRKLRVEGLDGVAGALRTLGTWLGTQDVADAAARAYLAGLVQWRARYAHARRLRVLYQLGVAPAYTVLRDSPITAALAVCGGDNIFGDRPGLAAPVSDEAVLARAPQVVLFDRGENLDALHRYWSRLPAAHAPLLHAVDGSALAHASPRVLEGIAQVCAVLDEARAPSPPAASAAR